MYRQILVDESQQGLQCILWRNNTNEEVKSYTLKTLTYGTACASFLSTRCLHQLAKEQMEKYPISSKIILNDFYVDDLITGVNLQAEALNCD